MGRYGEGVNAGGDGRATGSLMSCKSRIFRSGSGRANTSSTITNNVYCYRTMKDAPSSSCIHICVRTINVKDKDNSVVHRMCVAMNVACWQTVYRHSIVG